jgi:hypothetical protein
VGFQLSLLNKRRCFINTLCLITSPSPVEELRLLSSPSTHLDHPIFPSPLNNLFLYNHKHYLISQRSTGFESCYSITYFHALHLSSLTPIDHNERTNVSNLFLPSQITPPSLSSCPGDCSAPQCSHQNSGAYSVDSSSDALFFSLAIARDFPLTTDFYLLQRSTGSHQSRRVDFCKCGRSSGASSQQQQQFEFEFALEY